MNPHPAAAAPYRQRGFTLLELVVVLAILSLAVVTLAPFANPWRRGAPIDVVAREVVLGLRTARTAAIFGNREAVFTFDAGAGQYWSDAAPARRSLPARISATIGSGDFSRAQIRFFPDGGASGATIVLRDAGRTAVIEVEAPSGKALAHVSR